METHPKSRSSSVVRAKHAPRVRGLIPNGVPRSYYFSLPYQITADLQASGATKEGKYVRAGAAHPLVYNLRTHLHNRVGRDR